MPKCILLLPTELAIQRIPIRMVTTVLPFRPALILSPCHHRYTAVELLLRKPLPLQQQVVPTTTITISEYTHNRVHATLVSISLRILRLQQASLHGTILRFATLGQA